MDPVDQTIKREILALRQGLTEDVGERWKILEIQCYGPEKKRPLYFTHLPIALATIDGKDIPNDVIHDLNLGYVYLVSSIYALDSLVDKDKQQHQINGLDVNAVDLPTMLSISMKRMLSAIYRFDPSKIPNFLNIFSTMQSENAMALYEEALFRTLPLRCFDYRSEFFYMWARSNVFIFLFQAVALLNGQSLEGILRESLTKFLYVMQWGDDICDWREDYKAKKWTPFLRNCFNEDGKILKLRELEAVVYDRMYEKNFNFVIQEFESILANLAKAGINKGLYSFVEHQRAKVHHLLTSFLNEKHR